MASSAAEPKPFRAGHIHEDAGLGQIAQELLGEVDRNGRQAGGLLDDGFALAGVVGIQGDYQGAADVGSAVGQADAVVDDGDSWRGGCPRPPGNPSRNSDTAR